MDWALLLPGHLQGSQKFENLRKFKKIENHEFSCFSNLSRSELLTLILYSSIFSIFKRLSISSSTALFIPTLVESFGLIYLEAMKYKSPILTSDRDFSRWMCGKLAMYFDPLDHISIADTLEKYVENPSFHKYNKNVNQRLKNFPKSWEKVTERYTEIIKNFI